MGFVQGRLELLLLVREVFTCLPPCHRREWNPNSAPYKMFQMIFFVCFKTIQNMLVFEILNKSFMENQHSNSSSKPKFDIQPHLAQQQEML